MQDDTILPTFNPDGGPITHSSTGPKPDSPVHPYCQSYSSHLISYVIHGPPSCDLFCYQMQYLIFRCTEPLSHSVSDIERLPTRLKLLITPPYLALDDFLEFQLERCLYATFTEIAPRYLSCVELRPSRVFLPYSTS